MMKIIVVTSPVTDAGKTMLAAGLSETAASLNCKTLLVDVDNPPGELQKVFGYSHQPSHSNLGSWTEECWESCVRSPRGAYLLPGNEMPGDSGFRGLEQLISSAGEYFDLVVIDLCLQPGGYSNGGIVERADIAVLVADCDRKAMFRLNEFLESCPWRSCSGWTLCINNREGKNSYYSPAQMVRYLSRQSKITKTIEIPFYTNMEKTYPYTFEADEGFAVELLTPLLEPVEDSASLPVLPIEINTDSGPGESCKASDNSLFSRLLARAARSCHISGVVVDGQFVRESFDSPLDMLEKYQDSALDAVVIHVSMGFEAIKEYRRDPRSQSVLLIVIKGDRQHIAVGADRVAAKLNPELLETASFYAARLRELWSRVELDYLTACYKREFMEAWLRQQEQQERVFSIVFIDPDRFKSINDSFGHDAGDSVLSQFSAFLQSNSRCHDLICRWGGDEFVVAMPDTNARQAYVLIDRLREKWSARNIHLPGGETINCTFSAGVAEYYPGCNVVKIADEMMYQAKQNGRNQVKARFCLTIAALGSIPREPFRLKGYALNGGIDDADFIVCDVTAIHSLPENRDAYLLGRGTPGDWIAGRCRPDLQLYRDVQDIITAIEVESVDVTSSMQRAGPVAETAGHLAVLPGARASKTDQTLPRNGALFVVCPSRPGLAGEVAASLALSARRSALVCASPEATAALELKIPDDLLITSDWRLPGAKAPLDWGGLKVWPVDPHKCLDLGVRNGIYGLVEQIKSWFDLVVVDCGGSLSVCSRVANNEGILVLRKEGDSADHATTHWLKRHGNMNVMVMSPSEWPVLIQADNGLIISSGNNKERNGKYY